MLKLFANIFELLEPQHSSLPEQLIEAGTERAIDATDPRLRIVHGYARQLRDPIIHAAEHILGLIESLPAPVNLARGNLSAHPDLSAFFYSEERLSRLISGDPVLREYCKTRPGSIAPVKVLFTVQQEKKRRFGTAMVNGEVRSEVAQTTVTFKNHQFLDPCDSRDPIDRLLQRRAFDALLAVALHQISERQEERKHLSQHRALLRAKLDIVQRHGSFTDQHPAGEQLELQRRLDSIESELQTIGTEEAVLPNNLAVIAEVLGQAENHLCMQQLRQCLDRYYVLHEAGGAVSEIPFTAIYNSNDEQVLVRQLVIDRDMLP